MYPALRPRHVCTRVGGSFLERCAALRSLVRPREVYTHAAAASRHAQHCHDSPTEGVACYLRRLDIGYTGDEPADNWCSPAMTLRRGEGDCDDHSILAASLLRASGVRADVVLGWMRQPGRRPGYHAWVVGSDPLFGFFSMEPQSGTTWWGGTPPYYDAEAHGGPDGCWRVDRHMNVIG